MQHDVWITGIGLVTSLGEGSEANWQALDAGTPPALDRDTIPPYAIHPMVELDWSQQIPKRGDQRQMEPWQRLGVYAAGLALDDAGIKDDADLLDRMDMIVAAGGGERDIAVDNQIMTQMLASNDREQLLIEQLSNELRPTLFLAQLPNLIAGNISIVHGVTGSSRTFMGEEPAGHDAARTAHARIAAGQSKICLVGSSFNAAREDMVLLFEMGGHNWLGETDDVWARSEDGGGVRLGSMGAFLVLEAADHAKARGKSPVAAVSGVAATRDERSPGDITTALQTLTGEVGVSNASNVGVVSAATGIAASTAEEKAFLDALGATAIRAVGSRIGHGVECQFLAAMALAALSASHGKLFAPTPGSNEAGGDDIASVLVTSVGHWRGEGVALVTPARAE